MARKAGKVKEAENTQEQSFSIENEQPGTTGTSSIVNLGEYGEQEGQQFSEQNGKANGINDSERPESPYSPLFVLEETPPAATSITNGAINYERAGKAVLSIVVPSVERRWEYRTYHEAPVDRVLQEYNDGVEPQYIVSLRDGSKQKVTYDSLIKLRNGALSLERFSNPSRGISYASGSVQSVKFISEGAKPRRSRRLVDLINMGSSEDELSTAKPYTGRRRLLSAPKRGRPHHSRSLSSRSLTASQESSSDASGPFKRRESVGRPRGNQTTRSAGGRNINYQETVPVDDTDIDDSDDSPAYLGKRKRTSSRNTGYRKSRVLLRGPRQERPRVEGTRRSERSRNAPGNMRELGEDEIPDTVFVKESSRAVGAKENFKEIPEDNDFRLCHNQMCDACDEYGNNHEKGVIVLCQGCTLSYHQRCLGPRNARDHLVTKVGPMDFVLQCRRCIEAAKRKDPLAPSQSQCSSCGESGKSTQPLRDRKTTIQEQKDREENDGEDPITEVSPHLINKVNHLLFRCVICYRAFHMHHLPAKADNATLDGGDEEQVASDRFSEYCEDWSCFQCVTAPAEVEGLIAWRPINEEAYIPGNSAEVTKENAKEYLIKWKQMSYFKSTWMPGPWVWGVTSGSMRKAFARRDNQSVLPKMSFEDAVPEEYLRVDIVFDVEYTNVVKVQVEKVDLARIREVRRALVKFKGLGYEDVVWEEPPDPEDADRWADFKAAYEDWVRGKYVHLPVQQSLSAHLKRTRSQNFEQKIMMKEQPEALTGGELMAYQLEGLNWLYYQWHKRQNALLADEMGLGKTIQVIAFLATLKHVHGCWPFLIVVPNSTCPNWRREIKQWAPSLRVVMYFGSAEARKLALKHELFPGGGKDLRCHVVVTSYDAAQDGEFRKGFRGISWAGLVVDEGQRLKNDKNILYGALNALQAPFKVLLTGTPLQNNPRELFNLLQFLDKSIDAQAMEEEYTTLTKDNLPKLHALLRPFFLRRTKAQVLTFLPSMAQIIVPVTMTVIQKKLYKSILAKNPELIKAIFGGSQRTLKATERASLNNILMQLRKCLCHPFVYSRAIEERSTNAAVSHRNLVDASSKLQLLEVMLPKLQERGHRVLIFSQFLDMLDMIEDFLDGLGLYYQRLDGNVSSLQKQKRIDEFNAPDSNLFAFLLSTRAGGVGINLATADTVIILDPDFNPHQDIQALSRAHRIGQKKKVLVFQLTTRATAEEKIMQIGKKKMALDHVLIEQMDAEDDAGMDLETILRHGTAALFKDDDTQDIRYDSVSVDKLLDRSQVEDTSTGQDNSAESQFSFARVWANEKGVMEESLETISQDDGAARDPSVWEKILKDREHEVALEAAAKMETLGRGKRARQTVDYTKQTLRDLPNDSPQKDGLRQYASDSDTDFQARGAESDGEESGPEAVEVQVDAQELQPSQVPRPSRGSAVGSQDSPMNGKAPGFRRAQLPAQLHNGLDGSMSPPGNAAVANDSGLHDHPRNPCPACSKFHKVGFCPLKLAGNEYCALCGLAHYGSGFQRICPHLNSVTQCRVLLETIKQSNEPREIKDRAKKYIVGIIGDLNNRKKKTAQQALQARQQRAPLLEDSAPTSVGANYYAPPYHSDSAGLGRENDVIGFDTVPLASRAKPRRHGEVRQEEFTGKG